MMAYTSSEKICASLLMLVSAVMWGYTIAAFCGVVTNLGPEVREFAQRYDELNSFMARQGMPLSMRQRLREYFLHTKTLQVNKSQMHLINQMSPKLQGEVTLFVNKWISTVWFFAGIEVECIVHIAISVTQLVFSPGELLPPGYLYVVKRGWALVGDPTALNVGRPCKVGDVWGEDIILQSPILQSKLAAQAMTFLDVFLLSRAPLLGIIERYPKSARHLRKCAIRLAFKRGMRKVVYTMRARELSSEQAIAILIGQITDGSQATASSSLIELQSTLLESTIGERPPKVLTCQALNNDSFHHSFHHHCQAAGQAAAAACGVQGTGEGSSLAPAHMRDALYRPHASASEPHEHTQASQPPIASMVSLLAAMEARLKTSIAESERRLTQQMGELRHESASVLTNEGGPPRAAGLVHAGLPAPASPGVGSDEWRRWLKLAA